MIEPNEEPRRPIALWVGLIGAGVTAIAGMFGMHNASVWRLPAVLEARVEQALLAADFGGLEVEMDGQRAKLRGLVGDEAAIAAATRAALSAAGAGGPWAGGVTVVDASGVELGRVDSPYYWRAWREEGRIVLEGAAPSEAAREELMEAARTAFPNARAVDGMHIAGGAASPRFTDMAREGVRAIARLNTGEVRIADSQIVFIGDGNNQAFEALKSAFANPPAPFRARIDVTVDGIDLAHPELQGLNLARGDADACAAAFDRVMERNVINFATNSAAIDPSSRQILDALASVALRCDRFSIEVAGHTDSQGAHDLNMELSTRRAQSVANYLAGQGVERGRLSARGYGSDRPRASNATPEGQAANRRIEFNVAG
ncbi:MAG TPA: OmpA family protein [Terricaulis sp.]|nr:OmpA family protein [Terricaulis sp.]